MIDIVGLGPAGLEHTDPAVRTLVEDATRRVIVRTLRHPAASDLAAVRAVVSADDLYDRADTCDDVYAAVAERVLTAAADGNVVYAVPGSPHVGERAVPLITQSASAAGIEWVVHRAESFLDRAMEAVGIDPIAHGLRILNGRALPHHLVLDGPMFVTQVDSAMVAADVAAALGRLLDGDTPVTVLEALGSPEERVTAVPLHELARQSVGDRTTIYLDPPPVGWVGLVDTNRRLRAECPWDADQTHHSLVSHLVEEAFETVDALSALPPDAPSGEPDYQAYARVEEELGDLLLQSIFHATLAEEAGAFTIEEVAESIRRKLVNRHPHVFGDVDVAGVTEVLDNWEAIKAAEKQRNSIMDDVPSALPGVARAAKLQRRAASIGFDWSDTAPVFAKVQEELAEVRAAAGPAESSHELGDLLFAIVNLSRHLDVDAELALRQANERFEARFRLMESMGPLEGLTLSELDERWELAKAALSDGGGT